MRGTLALNQKAAFHDRLETMIRKVLPLLATLAFAASAHAQLAAYGTVTLNSLGGSGTSPLAPKVDATGAPVQYLSDVNPIGGTFGVYYDFKSFGPIRLGVDARGVITNSKRGAELSAQGIGVRIGSGLAGVRAVIRTPLPYLKPYVQGSAGIGKSDYGFLTTSIGQPKTVSNFEYHIYAGADLRVLPVVDWRVVELGYGGMNPFGTDSHNYPLRSVSTGIVFHFPYPF